MRKPIALAAALAAALPVLLLAAPSASAGTGVTFTISAGLLTIAQPSSTANLGTITSTPLGTTTAGSLGTTTVNDARGSLAGWTVSMSSTDFSDGASHTISAAKAVAYLPSVATVNSGIAVVTNTHLAALTGLTLGNSSASFLSATATGSNNVSYNPTVQVTIDSDVLAGTYTGTVTQSVA